MIGEYDGGKPRVERLDEDPAVIVVPGTEILHPQIVEDDHGVCQPSVGRLNTNTATIVCGTAANGLARLLSKNNTPPALQHFSRRFPAMTGGEMSSAGATSVSIDCAVTARVVPTMSSLENHMVHRVGYGVTEDGSCR